MKYLHNAKFYFEGNFANPVTALLVDAGRIVKLLSSEDPVQPSWEKVDLRGGWVRPRRLGTDGGQRGEPSLQRDPARCSTRRSASVPSGVSSWFGQVPSLWSSAFDQRESCVIVAVQVAQALVAVGDGGVDAQAFREGAAVQAAVDAIGVEVAVEVGRDARCADAGASRSVLVIEERVG